MVIDVLPSHADSLPLVGGELALDFANTSSARGLAAHRDHFQGAEHVAQWAAHARVLGREDAQWLAEQAQQGPLGVRLLDAALSLREDIYEIGAALGAGRPAPPERTETLAKAHTRVLAKARLAPLDGHFGWVWSVREFPVEAVVGPISLSALSLLQQADLARVKQCQGDRCGWLFFDTTKNKSRRWCEMEVCGNRAKQKRFVRAKAV